MRLHNTKITPIGPVHKYWTKLYLENICEFITKGATPTTYGYDWVEDGIPFLRSECVTDTGFNEKGLSYISEEANKALERSIVKSGDLLISITGNVGRVAIFPSYLQKGNINQHIARIRILEQDSCDRMFIYYLLSHNVYRKYYNGIITGAAYPQLSLKQIRETPVYFPPLPTQRRIATILSAYDDLIANNIKRIKLLEEKAQLTYEEWFVRKRFPGHETVKIDKESGLPEGWEKTFFEGSLRFKTGKLDSNALIENGDYDFYTCAKEVYKTNSYCFEGEAVLLGGNNATGDFALFYANDKFDAYQRTYIVTSVENTIPLVYVYFYLKKLLPYFQIVSSGASTKFLTMKILNKTKILVPEYRILSKFNALVKPCFDSILNFKKQNQLLKEARDILLPRLMTGMIDADNLTLESEEDYLMVAEDEVRYGKLLK